MAGVKRTMLPSDGHDDDDGLVSPDGQPVPPPKKPMSGAKKTEAQKKAELEAIMQMSPSSKAKALEKRAARQAAAQRAADTRKKTQGL